MKKNWQPTGQAYVGENAFGVKRQITKVDLTELVVAVPAKVGSVWWPKDFKAISISVPQDQAKRTKENLVVLFAARLKDPYFEIQTGRVSPTISSPYDVDKRKEIVHLNLDCAAIYDKSANKVIPI